MSACPALPNLGIAQELRPDPSTFECTGSQVFTQAPAGTFVNAELVPLQLYLIFGIPFFQQNPPTLEEYRQEMAAAGHTLMYLEIWENVSTILGFGWESIYYIGVWF